jgi:hypothetical protein
MSKIELFFFIEKTKKIKDIATTSLSLMIFHDIEINSNLVVG